VALLAETPDSLDERPDGWTMTRCSTSSPSTWSRAGERRSTRIGRFAARTHAHASTETSSSPVATG
jgi:hypothetical protein